MGKNSALRVFVNQNKVDLSFLISNVQHDKINYHPLTGDYIYSYDYVLTYGSDKKEDLEQKKVWRPSSCTVEQSIILNLPDVIKQATVLLKIITGPVTIPHFSFSVPKSCKFTSYYVKNCLFWALREGPHIYPFTEDKHINKSIRIAVIILASYRTKPYFSFDSREKMLHPFLSNNEAHCQ